MTIIFPPVVRQQAYRKLLPVRKDEASGCLQVSIKRRRMSRKQSSKSLFLLSRNLWIYGLLNIAGGRATREDNQEDL